MSPMTNGKSTSSPRPGSRSRNPAESDRASAPMVGLDELFHHGRNLLAPAPTAGVFSEGLKTTALPAIKAGTICPFGKCAGKLYGPSTATAPCGLWRTALRKIGRAHV